MAATLQRKWVNGNFDQPDRPCPAGCGASFYTSVGLAEHTRVGCGNGHGSPVKVTRRWWMTDEGQAKLRERGLAVTALNNARRMRCGDCELVSKPGPLAVHQRATGHVGRVELT